MQFAVLFLLINYPSEIEVGEPLNFHPFVYSTMNICLVLFIGHAFCAEDTTFRVH